MVGLKGTLGLYSSNEWWKNIENGNFRELTTTGIISRLYTAGQDNNGKINSFDMIDNNGNTISSGIYLNNQNDLYLFEIGKKFLYFIFMMN